MVGPNQSCNEVLRVSTCLCLKGYNGAGLTCCQGRDEPFVPRQLALRLRWQVRKVQWSSDLQTRQGLIPVAAVARLPNLRGRNQPEVDSAAIAAGG